MSLRHAEVDCLPWTVMHRIISPTNGDTVCRRWSDLFFIQNCSCSDSLCDLFKTLLITRFFRFLSTLLLLFISFFLLPFCFSFFSFLLHSFIHFLFICLLTFNFPRYHFIHKFLSSHIIISHDLVNDCSSFDKRYCLTGYPFVSY